MRCLVIADDFTGAAECAGVGWQMGMPVSVHRGQLPEPAAGMTVVDTASRSLPSDLAHERLESLLSDLSVGAYDLIYKKIDSVLRGPVGAELGAVMRQTGYARSLLLPQNPRRGRCIAGGTYTINGQPLHLTRFADDPTCPATTSRVADIIAASSSLPIVSLGLESELPAIGVTVGDGNSPGDFARWAERAPADALLAGGAEFLRAVLATRGFHPLHGHSTSPVEGRVLIVQGSVSSSSLAFVGSAGHLLSRLPDAVESHIDQCTRNTIDQIHRNGVAVLAGPLEVRAGRAVEISHALADVAVRVMKRAQINQLFIAGGDTAAAILSRLGWDKFDFVAELADGACTLKPAESPNHLFTVKPGSYEWPEVVRQCLTRVRTRE